MNVPTLADRLAIAAIVSAFALSGLAAVLDGQFDTRHGPRSGDSTVLYATPFLGAIVARALIRGARHVYASVVAIAASIGIYSGMETRPWTFWYPPVSNTAWVAAWTLAAAIVGTLWTRREEPAGITRTLAIVIGVVLLVFVLLALPSILRAA